MPRVYCCSAVFEPQSGLSIRALSVLCAGDAQEPGDPRRTIDGDLSFGDWVVKGTRAQKYCRGIVRGAGHDVRKPVHAVYEIDIEPSRFAEHYFRTLGPAAMCMRCLVARSVVGLHFGDHECDPFITIAPYDVFPDEVFRNDDRRTVKEILRKDLRHRINCNSLHGIRRVHGSIIFRYRSRGPRMVYNKSMIQEKDLPKMKDRVLRSIHVLRKLFPDARISLKYSNNWELLVAVELSAQCTDKKVNEVTQTLFKKYRTFDKYLHADRRTFEQDIRQTGFYRAKAKNILAAAKVVKERFHGKLPKTMDEMLTIPGIGRKSANVILGNAYGIAAGIAVDTHVKRLARVLGLSDEKTPEKIEKDLMRIIPKKDWIRMPYLLIEYGRKYCVARPHEHALCPLTDVVK